MPKLDEIRPQSKNANKHTERGLGMLEKSIQRDGWIGAITVAADGETFDGSARVEVGVSAGFEDAIVVESDGTKPIIVKRQDIPNAGDPRAKRLGIAANRVAQADLEWDAGILAELSQEIDLSDLWNPQPEGGSWIVWDKRTEDTAGFFGNHFELCWSRVHHRREMKRFFWCANAAHDPGEQRVHPTQKPVALIKELIGKATLVVDPFLGSGTTLIAAEQLGRKCYGLEIEPKYCDVILQRWENATGKKAELIKSRKPHDSTPRKVLVDRTNRNTIKNGSTTREREASASI